MRFRVYTFVSLILVVLLGQGCSTDGRVTIHIGEVSASVELAVTADARSVGLMHRKALGEDEGLLMVMPRPKVLRIWMLNTHIPLDVGFFDESGQLLNHSSMEPDGGEKVYRSSAPALYALEMNEGWFERHGVEPGDRLRLPYPVVGE